MSIDNVGRLDGCAEAHVFIIMKGRCLTLVWRESPGASAEMRKVTPLGETPTHWVTVSPDDMLISMTLS